MARAPQDEKTRIEAPAENPSDPDLPRRIGRFHVLGKLGVGAQGQVLLGYDGDLNRKVAIKLLRSRKGGADEQDRMRREAQALAQLSHPNVVQVYEVGNHDGSIFLAMEYVSGPTLHAWAKEHSAREVLGAYIQAGHGLAAAHGAGLIHRDFKPLNAMLGRDGRVRVMDFGLARGELAARNEENTVVRAPHAVLWSGMTEAGSLMGTPAYMAPEQWKGGAVDARTDQFAFCVSLWEGLYRERPYVGKTIEDFRDAILSGRRREPPANLKVPAWLRQIVERGMAIDPAQRWPSMAALLAALESGAARRRQRIAALGGLGLAALVALAVVWGEWSASARVDACRATGRELADQWERAAPELRAAFEAAAPGLGESTFARTAAHVERFTAAWADARARVCMLPGLDARWSPELIDRAEECLLEARWSFEGTLERFAAVDADVVYHAVPAVAELPAPAPCLDLPRLARQPAAPADPQVRDEVLQVRQALRQVRTLGATGHYKEGLAAMRPLIERADAIGWRPLAARVRLLAARFAADLTELALAEAWLDEAMIHAAETGQDLLLAEIAASLTDVVGVRLARQTEGLRWGRLARAMMVAQGDADTLRGGQAQNSLALLLLDRGELDEAGRILESMLASAIKRLGPDDLAVAGTLINLGNLDSRRERYEDARRNYQRSLELFERHLGPEHPEVALALGNLAINAIERGDLDTAERLGRRALAIRERTAGPEHLETARAQRDLGDVYSLRGETAKALGLLERSAIGTAKALGPEHPDLSLVLISLGELHLGRRDFDKAQRFYARALAISERARGSEHFDVAWPLVGLGEVALGRGRGGEAVRHFERALAIFAANQRERDAALARFALARARWLKKPARAEARALAREAAQQLEALGAAEDRAEVEAWLARR